METMLKILIGLGVLFYICIIIVDATGRTRHNYKFHGKGFWDSYTTWENREMTPADVWLSILWPIRGKIIMPRTSARITCKNCGAYLGMDEGWYEECESCRNSDTFAAAARQVHKELKTLRGVIFDEAKREYKAIKDKIKRRKK